MDFQIEPLRGTNMSPALPGKNFFGLSKLKILLGVVGVLFLISIIFFFLERGSFKENGVSLKIDAPSEIAGGELVTYKIQYKNNNSVSLSNVRLNVLYPSDAVVIKDGNVVDLTAESVDIGTIRSNESGEKDFIAYIVGDSGNIKTFKSSLTYNTGNLSSIFSKNSDLATTITSLAVPITLVATPTIISGQSTSYLIDYRNQTNQDLDNLRFIVKYPQGFVASKFTPNATTRGANQSTWDVVKLKQGDGSRITIEGVLSGNEKESKVVSVVLQKQVATPAGDVYIDFEKSDASSIISSPILSLDTRLNDADNYVAHLGDNLHYRLTFKNNNGEGISGLSLSVKLDGNMYDLTSVESGGFFDSRLNTIFWNASTVPAFNFLGVNQSGTVDFNVRLKGSFSGSSGAKDSFVKTSAHLETTSVPANLDLQKLVTDDELVTRISAAPTFDQKIFVNDSTLGSVGPFPPKVNQKTLFTTRWSLVNPSNDVSQAKITGTLAPGVVWENQIKVNGTQIQPTYDSRSNTVTWNLGTLPGGTGVSFPIYEGIFQISITPSVNQLGQPAPLLRNVHFDGVDSFTKEKISRTILDASTANVSDNNSGGRVQP